MHRSMNIKFINAKQAIEIHAYNVEIINSITKLLLVVYFYWFMCQIRAGLNEEKEIITGLNEILHSEL